MNKVDILRIVWCCTALLPFRENLDYLTVVVITLLALAHVQNVSILDDCVLGGRYCADTVATVGFTVLCQAT